LLNEAINNLTTEEEVSIPVSKLCACKLQIEFGNIVDLAIKPAIKNVISIIASAVKNLDIFGLYCLDHIFVAYNYRSSIFHH
jgi:hypothetical protein